MDSALTLLSEHELAARFAKFLADWVSGTAVQPERKASSSLLDFSNGWRDIAHEPRNVGTQIASSLAADRFEDFALQFRPLFAEFRSHGEQFNVWKAAQLGRHEVRNCSVLARFLDHSAEHGQGSGILEPLLSIIGLRDIAARATSMQYLTRTGSWPLANADSCIDIEIEAADFLLFIEVKIDHSETGDQLRRYVDLARRKAAHRDWSLIFLTPDRRPPTDLTFQDVPELKLASWKDVAEAMRRCVRSAKASPIHDHLLRYAEFVETFT
jgi:hypothetical protein